MYQNMFIFLTRFFCAILKKKQAMQTSKKSNWWVYLYRVNCCHLIIIVLGVTMHKDYFCVFSLWHSLFTCCLMWTELFILGEFGYVCHLNVSANYLLQVLCFQEDRFIWWKWPHKMYMPFQHEWSTYYLHCK